MNVLMYPLGPDDNFPDEFCAIRQGSGELTFYMPEGESASWMLFRAESDNAKLRSLSAEVAGILFNLEVDRCGLCDRDSINHPCPVHTVKGGECLIKSELRELGVEVE